MYRMPLKEKNPGQNRVLLSGGTGFLGSYIAKALVKSGFDVSILKRQTSELKNLEGILNEISLINRDEFSGGSFDFFIHAATVYGRKKESKEEMWKANVDFPIEILEKIENDDLHFINLNTSLPSKTNLYAESKHLFAKKTRDQFPRLRMSNLLLEQFYGPHDGTFLSFLVESFKKKKEELDLTEGLQIRDFIYFTDVISAIKTVMTKSELGDIPIGTGAEYTIQDIVKLTAELIGDCNTKLNFGVIPYRDNEVMSSVADISKLKAIGWKPQFTLREGIKKTLENW